jgi:PX-associated
MKQEPDEQSTTNGSDLTPLRAHYLKKSLVQLQFGRELDLLASTDVPGLSNLSLLGAPFSPIPKALAPSLPSGLDLPFLKYIFRQFVLTFPFMDAAPKNFYSEKVQPFVDAMVERNIASASSSSLLFDDFDGAAEQGARKKLISKIEKNMSLFIGSATKLVEQEEVVRLTQADLDRLERLRVKRAKKNKKNKDYFEVNIVGVRTVVDKGRMRTRAHEVRGSVSVDVPLSSCRRSSSYGRGGLATTTSTCLDATGTFGHSQTR